MRQYVELPAPIPDEHLIYPCEPVGPGSTNKSLENAYVYNTGCIGQYKGVIDGLHTYNNKIKKGNEEVKSNGQQSE